MAFEQGQTIYVLHRGFMDGTYLDEKGKEQECLMNSPTVVQRGTVISVDKEGTIRFKPADIIDAFGNEKFNTIINPYGQEEPLGLHTYPDSAITSPIQDVWCHEKLDQAVNAMHRINRKTIERWKDQEPKEEADKELVSRIKDLYSYSAEIDQVFADAIAAIPASENQLGQ